MSQPLIGEHEHTPEAIRARLAAGARHSYLRDFIYGGIDGTVTTFAVVAGVEGARLSSGVVLVLGFANLIADGFSMAASNYVATRAEHDDRRRMEAIERRHIELAPEGEREEVRQIYEGKGFAGAELERVVELVTADRRRWIETMLAEEYGLARDTRSPVVAAVVTFLAFVVCGIVPLVPFLFGAGGAFAPAALSTCLVFFLIGAAKSRWGTQRWWASGLQTLSIGAAAAALAYFVGVLLKEVA